MSLSFEDKRVQALGARFRKIYAEAEKGMAEKVNSFFANFKALDIKKKALVDAGKLTQKEYDKWRQNKLLMGEKYKDLRDSIADNMLHANERAAEVINHELPNVYAHNFNQVGEGVERKVQGYSFDLTNPETVRKLATDDTTLLPYKFIDGHRDERWNSTKVNSQILQGILQGESADQMAKRLMNISVMNQESALRNARTAVTSAQNKGRVDAMKQCEDDGVIMGKEWIATKDERTREAHAELDRVVVGVDEPFENEIGEIMYPGDPDADPANTYNCRCTIAEVVLGFKPKEKEPEPEVIQPEPEFVVAQGKDITDTWERRPDKFDFAIDDVINAQGFDGLPHVVSQEEFDEAVKDSGLYAQRVYSAQTEEALEAYRKELYGGKFYVDCSVGGADFGQGMYMSGDFTGKKVKDVMEDSNRYVAISENRGNKHSFVEKMTLDKDSKIATYDSLLKEYQTEAVSIQNDITRNVGHKLVEEAVDKYGLSGDDRNFLLWGLNIPKEVEPFDLVEASKYSGDKKFINSIRNDISSKIIAEKSANPIISANGDMGIYGTMKGYDAINIEGQAANGTSQVLVLNRTKLVILGGK